MTAAPSNTAFRFFYGANICTDTNFRRPSSSCIACWTGEVQGPTIARGRNLFALRPGFINFFVIYPKAGDSELPGCWSYQVLDYKTPSGSWVLWSGIMQFEPNIGTLDGLFRPLLCSLSHEMGKHALCTSCHLPHKELGKYSR